MTRFEMPVQVRIELLDHRAMATATSIHRVLARAHAQEAGQLKPEHRTSTETSVEALQAGDECYLGALTDDDQLAGGASIGADDEPGQIRVLALFVDPQYQRRGIARQLMLEVVRRGDGAVLTVITTTTNAPALALYEGLGFRPYRRGVLGASQLEILKLRYPPR